MAAIVNEARTVLREQFVRADVGITGANFLVADSGSSVLVTNEGNGDLTSSLPKVHIITASIEKVIPSYKDLSVFLRLLGRSATGQEMSAYTSIYRGPAQSNDMDGPDEFHVVILDNGRSKMLEGEFWEMLRCIRCGACMNHCPRLPVSWRSCLRVGLPRTNGVRLDSAFGGTAERGESAQCLHPEWTV